MADLEGRGIPGVGVATTEFVDAVAAQSRALGFSPAMVFVHHPIQDRRDDELRALADQVFETIVEHLVQNASPA
ncbi:hypothetical protein HC341_01830 [Aquisalimonas sp. 2447]|nr:hypothetical protein HC341_01830 [Aquisalimonas sp. 2447]